MKQHRKNQKVDVGRDRKRLRKINPNAAGIDVGSKAHWVAVSPDRATESTRSFGVFTEDLHAIARWLIECRIETVAMEATGVYWIPLFEVLESYGLDVVLVNARHVHNVSGRKSDVLDCEWLQELHSFGLLSGAYRPPDKICAMRGYLRHRRTLVEIASSHIQHMQKALRQMNLLLDNVVGDISGVTGMKIIRDILAGERRPETLAENRDYRCKNSRETIAKSLVGNYREEHLFALRQSVRLFDTYQELIHDCDAALEALCRTIEPVVPHHELPPPAKPEKSARGNFQFDARTMAFGIAGVDLTLIPGIQAQTAMTVISECGVDMSKWKTDKHFGSWLSLCPGTKISGGRRLRNRSQKNPNRAATALRLAAVSLEHTKTSLGAFYRRLRSRHGAPKAITATAHKLARIIYQMLKTHKPYLEPGENAYQIRYKTRIVANLSKTAASLGFTLVPTTPSHGAVS